MAGLSSERDVLLVLNTSIKETSDCMIKNRCMGEGNCPENIAPIICFNDLEANRNSVKLIYQSISPSGGEAWTGEASKKAARIPRR